MICIHIKLVIVKMMCVCTHTCISIKNMRREDMNWKDFKEGYIYKFWRRKRKGRGQNYCIISIIKQKEKSKLKYENEICRPLNCSLFKTFLLRWYARLDKESTLHFFFQSCVHDHSTFKSFSNQIFTPILCYSFSKLYSF